MSKEIFELSRRVNRFIMAMQKAEHLWRVIQEQVGGFEISRDEMETAPFVTQRILTMFGKSRFSVMLPRFVDKARTSGGFEEMLCDLGELRKELKLDKAIMLHPEQLCGCGATKLSEDGDVACETCGDSIEKEEVVNG